MIANNNIYIHLGLHKTASTFFQKSFYPLYKEFNYKHLRDKNVLADFNQYILRENEISFTEEEAIRLLFKNLKEHEIRNERITLCEEQFSGFPLQNAYNRLMIFRRLNSIFPNAKYILILRNQKDFIKSMYAEYLKKGGDVSLSSFLSVRNTHLNFSRGSYMQYYRYYDFIRKSVGNQNLLLLPYEDLLFDRIKFFESLLNFMDLKIKFKNFDFNQKNNISFLDKEFEAVRFYNKIGKTAYSPNHIISPKYKPLILKWANFIFDIKNKENENDKIIENYIKNNDFQNELLPFYDTVKKYGY